MKAEEEKNKPAAAIVSEGEKVTGGSSDQDQTGPNENAGTSSPTGGLGEAAPKAETKKEDMNSYNEHPDQAKVGGG